MKPKVFIIFPDEWASYSPTLLNLVEQLNDRFEVRVLSFDNGLYKNDLLPASQFRFIRFPLRLTRFLEKFRLYKPSKAITLWWNLRNENADHVIGVDSIGFWVAQSHFGRAHYLSLEARRDYFFKFCRTEKMRSVIIQTQERFEYLFGSKQLKTFFIQNAPSLPAENSISRPADNHLIYFGNIIPSHGIYQCLDAMRFMPKMRLTVKGIMSPEIESEIKKRYSDLIESQQLALDSRYLPQNEVVPFLSHFSAGFCFYDFELIQKNDFNYLSSPSGKLFNYYAAQVPIIGSDIIGLKTVRDYKAGVLLKSLAPEAIASAVAEVMASRETMSRGCAQAARDFDFKSRAQGFKDFLLSS